MSRKMLALEMRFVSSVKMSLSSSFLGKKNQKKPQKQLPRKVLIAFWADWCF